MALAFITGFIFGGLFGAALVYMYELKIMRKWINKFLCGLLYHKNKECDTKFKYDKLTQRMTVTETCSRCGDKRRFAFRKEN